MKSVLVATCKTWVSPAMLPHVLRDAGASITAFSPWHLKLNPYVCEHVAGSRHAGDAATQLYDLISRRRFDWVIIADEYLLRATIEGCDLSNPPSWLPFDPHNRDAQSLLLSKHGFAECAPRFGIRVPGSHFASTVEEVALHAKQFGFPIIIKDAYGSAGDAVHIVTDALTLRSVSAKSVLAGKPVLVQRFVRGPLATADVLYDRGEVVGYAARSLECPFPLAISASTVRSPFTHPALDSVVRTVGAATRFHGLAGIDFVQDERTGELYALEINPRPTTGFSDGSATRAFFAPLLTAFLEEHAPRSRVFNGPPSAQFPAYCFYFLMRADKRAARSYRHVLDSLAKLRLDNAGLAGWQIARFTRDLARGLSVRKRLYDFFKGILVSVLGPVVWLSCKVLQWFLDQTDRYIESVRRVAR